MERTPLFASLFYATFLLGAPVLAQGGGPSEKSPAARPDAKRPKAPLIAVKTTGPSEGILGETAAFTVEVSNAGEADAHEVEVKSSLPAGLAYLDSSLAPRSLGSKQVSWDLGVLRRQEARRIRLTMKGAKTGMWTLPARVSSRERPPQTGAAVVRVAAPEIYVVKEGPEEVTLGQTAAYDLTVKNKGRAAVKEVVLREQVPAGLKFRDKTDGVHLKWNLGGLEPGASRKISYTVEAVRAGAFASAAEVSVGQKLVHKASFGTKVVAPDVKLDLSGPRAAYLHKPVAYAITVANEGQGSAKSLEVTSALPENLDYVASDPPGVFAPGTAGGPAVVTWNLPEIGPKTKVEIALTTRAKALGRGRTTAKLRPASPDPLVSNLEAFADLEIRGVPAMHVSSYDTEDPVEVGKQTVYVVEARNEGTSATTNIRMTCRIPAEMEFVSASGPGSFKAESGQVAFAPAASLAPGDKLVYKIVCKAVKPGSARHAAVLEYDQFASPVTVEESTSVYR